MTTNAAQITKMMEVLEQRTVQLQILSKEVIEIRTEIAKKNKIIEDYETIVKSVTSRKIKEIQCLKDELGYKNSVIKQQQDVINRMLTKLRKLDCLLPPNLVETAEQIRSDVTSTRSRAKGISAEPSSYQNVGKQMRNIEKFFHSKSPGYCYTIYDKSFVKFIHRY